MPRLNSGTERPCAPLLEPYITLVFYSFTVGNPLTVFNKIFSLGFIKRNSIYVLEPEFVRMLVSLGR